MPDFSFGSLFSGIGGIDLGLTRAGMVCRWQVEIDPFCRKVLAKHWPDVPRWDDVKTFPPPPAGEWKADLIAGGFPCQDVSKANASGEGIDGEKSGLWRELVRIIGVLRPRYVIVENVPTLLVRGLGRVLGDLAAIGYDAEWDCLSAADLGAAHLRDRIYIVAYPDGARLEGRRLPGPVTQQNQWPSEPNVGRVAYGVSRRMDRIEGLGNAVVPAAAEWLGRQILKAEGVVP